MNNVFKDFILSKKSLTSKLLDEISDYDIYCELIGYDIEIGKPIISPIRTDDDVPSFSLFIPTKIRDVREEELWWRDFRDGSGDVFKFVREFAKVHYGENLESRYAVIKFLDSMFSLGLIHGNEKKEYKKRKLDYDKIKESKEILFSSRKYTTPDLVYWASIGVDAELLRRYDVRSIHYFLDDEYNVRKKVGYYTLAYAFVVYDKIKVYMPKASSDRKWRNTCPAEYIQGWQQLEGKDVLIITKSFKDLLVFKSFMNVDVIAPQSEGSSFTDEQLQYIKKHYHKVYVVYDYDEAGKIGANKLAKNNGFIVRWVSTVVDDTLGKPRDKDISDFVNNHSLKELPTKLREIFFELSNEHFREGRVEYFESLIQELLN